MVTTHNQIELATRASTVTTLIDAMIELINGRRMSGLLLLGAASLSTRIPGIGTVASLCLRIYRRLS